MTDTAQLRALLADAHTKLAFLRGLVEIDGLSFGDSHPTIRGNFWWRSQHLPAIGDALNAAEPMLDEIEALRAAARALYLAGYWKCDRPVDEQSLWENLRDAAGIAPGTATAVFGEQP
jgi:hypothetical protein